MDVLLRDENAPMVTVTYYDILLKDENVPTITPTYNGRSLKRWKCPYCHSNLL